MTGVQTCALPIYCAPANAEIHSNAVEICDAADNDCNGQVDEAGAEGCAEWYLDGDQDGFGANQAAICLCAPDYLYTASTAGDCEDGNPAIHPDAEEVCNGLDDDCDGSGDPVDAPGCKIWYVDADADGYGDSDKGQCMCGAMTPYVVLVGADCEDLNVAVNPGQAEVCNGIDDNCDGDIDPPLVPGCINYFQDKDEDGWGVAEITKCLCEPKLPHTALQAGDCSDLDSEVNPAADEVCNDKDDDCDGKIDPAGTDGCVPHFKDGDQDGFGWLPVTKCLCLATQDFPVTNFGDCNDVDSGINPDQAELCNDVDDDCDYKVDEDFADKGKLCDGLDLDTCKNGTFTCREDGEGLECTNEDVVKAELCNGFDDDCDGSIDEDFPDTDDDGQADCMDNDDDGDTIHDILDNCPLHANEDQLDTDGDETGDACDEDDDEDGTVDDDDCEPLNPDVHPQAVEVCNGVDDNCSGETDEDFPDKSVPCDGDDTDLCKTGTWTCKADGSGLECINEVVKNVTEICDGEDNDCDGEFDENFPLKGTDCDGTDSDLCTNGTWTCKQAGDDVECVNEAIVDIPESCNNDDDDCDGETDEENADGCQTFHLDVDDDTYGTDATKCLCQATGDYTAGQPGDCSDGNGAVHPGAQEVCNNNIDDNCNGSTDEGCVTCKYMGTKYGNGDWSCPSGWRMPKQTEWTLVQPCVAGKESSYYHGTAYQVGGCNCKWNGSWCGQKSIDTFDQGRLCGDYWGHHVCVPN